MGKGGLYVYIRAPYDCPENMKLKKTDFRKEKKLKKMKNEKSYPFHPLTHPIKKINRPTPKNRNTAVFCV